ncbi:MAG: DUF697 domain-containing protein [Comamonas sp.]
MSKFSHRILQLGIAVLIVWVGIFTLAMVHQLAQAAELWHSGAGQMVFWILLAALGLTVAVPTIVLLRMPTALRYPAEADLHAVAEYEQRLRAHLAHNPRLQGQPLQTNDDIQAALTLLRIAAETETQRSAASVFVSTALLQNGRLDGLVVLMSQVQLVWRIARIYGLRPSLRQMSYLYGNVGASVLVAYGLEEVDFSELTAPIVHAAAPSAVGSVPGLSSIGSLLTNSLASGAANAFLTLRVGLVAEAARHNSNPCVHTFVLKPLAALRDCWGTLLKTAARRSVKRYTRGSSKVWLAQPKLPLTA